MNNNKNSSDFGKPEITNNIIISSYNKKKNQSLKAQNMSEEKKQQN